MQEIKCLMLKTFWRRTTIPPYVETKPKPLVLAKRSSLPFGLATCMLGLGLPAETGPTTTVTRQQQRWLPYSFQDVRDLLPIL